MSGCLPLEDRGSLVTSSHLGTPYPLPPLVTPGSGFGVMRLRSFARTGVSEFALLRDVFSDVLHPPAVEQQGSSPRKNVTITFIQIYAYMQYYICSSI